MFNRVPVKSYNLAAGKSACLNSMPARKEHPHTEADPQPEREISLWLDSYDDIFSDFDPRPYSERNISEDFLDEIKKISQERETDIALIRLMLPARKRKKEEEELIRKRLHNHFKKTELYYRQKMQKLKRRSIVFILLAVVMMLAASFLASLNSPYLLNRILFVITEPAGWFLMWTGLENLFTTSRRHTADLISYEKLAHAKTQFAEISQ